MLKRKQLTGSTVNLKNILHFKTGLFYLELSVMLMSGVFVDYPAFEELDMSEFQKLEGGLSCLSLMF